MRYSCSESRCRASVKGHDPVGVLPLCRLAEPAAHTHAGEAGFHNVGVVGRAALPAVQTALAEPSGPARRSHCGWSCRLWSKGPPATKLSHRASAAALSPLSMVSGPSPPAARRALMFPAPPNKRNRSCRYSTLFGACRQIKGHSTIAHADCAGAGSCRRRCCGFRR